MTQIIVFEGLDLTGKTTLSEVLFQQLINNKFKVKKNKGTLTFKGPYSNDEENGLSGFEKDLYYTYLLTEDKKTPLNIDKDYIIQDRYYPSVVYYGLLQFNEKSLASRTNFERFKQPDYFIYLRTTFEERQKRFLSRVGNNLGDVDSVRTLEQHHKRLEIYDILMNKINKQFGNVITFDTTNTSPEKLVKGIMEFI